MIKTVDNFKSDNFEQTPKLTGFGFNLDNSSYFFKSSAKNNGLNILFSDYIKSQNHTFFSFFKDQEKIDHKNQDDLIISIKKEGENYLAQTGNYVGRFTWGKNLSIEINSRFSQVFLKRMLNFANDIFLDDVDVAGKEVKDFDVSKFIIYYLFVQNLEKAFLLGLPKAYKSIKHHDMKLKGTIDINRFIKKDIPFQGKISSVSREQKEIPEIIDVLQKAVSIVENSGFSTKNISHIKTHLKQHRSKQFVSTAVINKAINAKALQNPIFAPYKNVLNYARMIIQSGNIQQQEKGTNKTYGFLINVAELFEIYVTKLLQKEFPDWYISSPKIKLYDKTFYFRKIIPDIVMEKGDKIMVFDTKYKRMRFNGTENGHWDLDRNDFFQIHTYASYYQNQKDKKLICAGLLYPLEAEYPMETEDSKSQCFSNNLLGNTDCRFLVDGINVSYEMSKDELLENERAFIKRIKKYTNGYTLPLKNPI